MFHLDMEVFSVELQHPNKHNTQYADIINIKPLSNRNIGAFLDFSLIYLLGGGDEKK